LCPPGFDGPNCQYVSGTVPGCDLDCQNGSYCTFDETAKQKQEEEQFMFRYWEDGDDLDDPNPVHARCECPEGFAGRYCEIETIPCGDNVCYNGGSCLERVVDGATVYHCDCTSSYTDTESYAGRFCQYPATSFCTKSGGLNGHLFCVNDGLCKDDPYQGCDCPDGFTGFSCEFFSSELQDGDNENEYGDNSNSEYGDGDNSVVYPDDYGNVNDNYDGETSTSVWAPPEDPEEARTCDLRCEHGGVCRVGVKQVGYLDDLSDNAPHLGENNDNFMHCVCPSGYYGVYCEEEVDVCGQDEHYCLHGSTCVPSDDVDRSHSCDCVNANSEVASVFAGDSCEHPVNDICNLDASLDTTPLSFCVNGGSCKAMVGAGES